MARTGDRSKTATPRTRQNNVRARELDKKTEALALHAYDHAFGSAKVSVIARKQSVPRSTVQRVRKGETPVNFYHALRNPKFGVPFITRFCRKYCADVKRGRR